MKTFKLKNLAYGLLGISLVAMSAVSNTNNAYATNTNSGTYQISPGQYFTCAIDASSSVICWGKNHVGQLGRGTTSVQETQGAVPGITDAKAISSGSDFACAIVGTGAVKCWGEGSRGQLGNGASLDSSSPVSVTGITNATQIEVAVESACALLETGSIQCWGSNSDGEIGIGGSITSVNVPTPIVSDLSFKSIELGPWTGCAVTTTGTPYCFGWNRSGQLGSGSGTPGTLTLPTQDAVVTDAKSISMSDSSVCILHGADNEVICRGAGYYGEMGNGTHASFNNVAPQYPQSADGIHISGVIALTDSWAGHCALKSDKTVWCWGNNDSKQRGVDVSTLYVDQVTGLSDVVAITGGWQQHCAVLTNATVKCWGRNINNELLNGTGVASYTPVAIPDLTVKMSGSTPPVTPTPTLTPTLRQKILTTMKVKKTQVLYGTTKQGSALSVTRTSGTCTVKASGSGSKKKFVITAPSKAGKCSIRISAPSKNSYKALSKTYTIKIIK